MRMRNKQIYCGKLQEYVSNPESLQAQKQSYFVQGNLTQTSLHGPMIWKVMQRNAWSDIASLRTKHTSNCTKLQLHALMTIISKKKNWIPWENCQKYVSQFVLKCVVFGTHWYTWHSMVGKQTCTSSHQMDQKLVTNAWLVWFLTFIIHMSSNNIVMWETLHNTNAGWDCFRTLILPETLKTRNRFQEEMCAYFEVTRSFQQVGCARNRIQFHTVSTEAEVISLDAGLRMDGIPALDPWYLVIEVFSFVTKPKPTTPNMWESHGETCRQLPSQIKKKKEYLLSLRQVPPPHRVRLHLKVRGCR